MSDRMLRAVLSVTAVALLAATVVLATFSVPAEYRASVGAFGGIGAVVLLVYLFTEYSTELMTTAGIAGIALALTAIAGNVVLLAGAAVTLLAFIELAGLFRLVSRLPPGARLDLRGRVREAGTVVLIAAAVAAVAAAGSVARLPSHVLLVALGAIAIAGLGKVVGTRADG
jgi:hypothetical protein